MKSLSIMFWSCGQTVVKWVSLALQTLYWILMMFRKFFKMPNNSFKFDRNKNSWMCEICQIIHSDFAPLHPWMEFEQYSSLRKTSWTFIPLSQHNFVSHTLSREILGSEALWPWLLASSGLSALVQLVTLPFFPDSPSYLLIQKGNEEACRKGKVFAFLTYFASFDVLVTASVNK